MPIRPARVTAWTRPSSRWQLPVSFHRLARPVQANAPKTKHVQRHRPREGSGQRLPFNDEPNIIPSSLRHTLEAHREANRSSLISKITEAGERHPLVLQRALLTANPLFATLHIKPRNDSKRGRRVTTPSRSNADHVGVCPDLIRTWSPVSPSTAAQRTPWLYNDHSPSVAMPEGLLKASEQLTEEIGAFDRLMRPNVEELAAAGRAISDLRGEITSVHPNLRVDLIGSRKTGLDGPLSDIDINLPLLCDENSISKPVTKIRKSQALRVLYEDMCARRAQGSAIKLERVIGTARIPIIEGRHRPTNLKFQIQATGGDFVNGEYVKAYQAEYPTLRPLFRVLKQMLAIRGLCDGKLGGIGSYPLLTMIVAALKFCESKFHRTDAGQQLRYFLDMYSEVNFETTAISLSPLEYTNKPLHPLQRFLARDSKAQMPFCVRDERAPYLMCLQDPLRPANDLGRQVRLIKHIQATFTEARRQMDQAMGIWDGRVWQSQQRREMDVALLDWCIGADYRVFQHDRAALCETDAY